MLDPADAAASGANEAGRGLPNGPSERSLERVFGHPVPEEELEIWASMPPSKRDKALQRMVALDRHLGSFGGLTAKQSAADAGLKLNRFYQMLRAWSERRSLASVGTFASTTKTRERIAPEIAQTIQAAVVRIVEADPDASVAALVRDLTKAIDIKRSPNTLRPFVERELRRRLQRRLAGEEVRFDCVATSLMRPDGANHVVFLVLDGGTGLILGQSIGHLSNSVAGYASAACDALGRIPAMMPPREVWADRTERSQLVPGTDAVAVADLVARARGAVGGVAPQILAPGSYGRYARAAIGLKVGPIRLLPSRTGIAATDKAPPAVDPLETADARARFGIAVSAHNKEVLMMLDVKGGNEPPEQLVRLLSLLAMA
ncbi:hypothetical protein [Sphingomonas sp. NPDC079357]|uniref:hypothetical protein n=1 Tax=Sphingomonas sp. NPDC079357 TaxID=3364518 RepID=UPI00384C876A